MSAREFAEWQAYFLLEPFGEERSDLRTGILAALTANIARDETKRREPYEPKDFMPNFNPIPKATQTWQEQLAIVEALNAAFGGNDLRGVA